MNILVLCTGNSARSILLEAILNKLGEGRVRAFSAGSQPTGQVHPQSIALLTAKGYDISGARSKNWDEFATDAAPRLDAVITVCASAAGETCPIWPPKDGAAPVRAHWGVEDPAAAPQAEWEEAFQTAYATLERRAKGFLGASFDASDKAALKAALDAAGEIA